MQHFGIEKIQIYSEENSQGVWKDLNSSSQLVNKCQLYVFQTDPNIVESQQKISKFLSRKPSASAVQHSAVRTASSTSSGTLSPVVAHQHGTYHAQHAAGALATTSAFLAGSALVGGEKLESSPIRFRSAPFVSSTPPPMVGTPLKTTPTHASSALRSSSDQVQSHNAASLYSAISRGSSTVGQLDPLPLSTLTVKHPGENASSTEKMRYLFAVINARRQTREIELADLRAFLEELNYGMSSTMAIADIFGRCDKDQNGKLNIIELTSFFQLLPTLMDSVYFRLLDAEDYRRLASELQQEYTGLENLRMKKQAMQENLDDVTADLRRRDADLQQSLSTHDLVERRGSDIRHHLQVVEHEADRIRAEREEIIDETKKQTAIIDSVKTKTFEVKRMGDEAEIVLKQHQGKLSSYQDRVVELQRQLAAAQAEVEHQRSVVDNAAREAQRYRTDEAELLQKEREASQGMIFRRDKATELDLLLQQKKSEHAELTDYFSRHQRELQDSALRLQQHRQAIQKTNDVQREVQSSVNACGDQIAQQQQRVAVLDEKVALFNQRKAAMEQRERPLLEQELMLLSQREALDAQEQRLRAEVGQLFYQNNGVAIANLQ